VEFLVSHPLFSDNSIGEYPNFQTNEQFVDEYMGRMFGEKGALVEDSLWQAVNDFFVGWLNGGGSRVDVVALSTQYLQLYTTNPELDLVPGLEDAAQWLANKVEVAMYQATVLELDIPGENLADFRAPLEGVDASDASVEAAKAALDEIVNPTLATVTASIDSDGAEGSSDIVVKLMLDEAQGDDISVSVATGNGADSATPGSDYSAVAQQVTFAAGETVKYVTIPVIDDSVFEADETVTINVTSQDADVATATITATISSDDRDPADVPTVTASIDSNGAEGSSDIVIKVMLDEERDEDVAVTLTSGGAGDTATAGSDYSAIAQQVTFAAGETVKFVTINVADDSVFEADDETVTISVTSQDANVATATITATISSDDPDLSGTLTTEADNLTSDEFTSQPEYTPGGNDLVNTLQDEDVLTGEGDNATLTAEIGSINDNAESVITPTMTNVSVVNVAVTGLRLVPSCGMYAGKCSEGMTRWALCRS
jgi:phosphotransferase system HPr-like phosphotransfer protein